EAVRFLRPGGILLCEFGLGQERQVKALVDRAQTYEGLEFFSNEAGSPRVFKAVTKQPPTRT
ncbi:MAG: methyltransferase, partial [Terriglobia bacterium]